MKYRWIAILALLYTLLACTDNNREPIQIGVLHSLTGTMAFSERALVDAITLAVEQINAAGGVLGRPLQPVVVDGASEWGRFAAEADNLINRTRVPVIFGCWTSACRKAVKPVIEQNNHLLFYPLQYEGLEHSPNIIYTGTTPNQQIIPSIHWALKNLGKRIYLVGSDYIFPRTANMIIKDILKNHKIEPLGEHYLPLGSTAMTKVMNEIHRLKPDLIINTINGDTNIAFFKALQEVPKTAVLSYSIAEPEIKRIGTEFMAGHYAAWSYFQSIATPENQQFVRAFKQRFGQDRVINDPMAAAYAGLFLWAQAVESAKTVNPVNVRNQLGEQSIKAPAGIISIDTETQHVWKGLHIGQIRDDGQFDLLWSSGTPIRPVPFPSYHSKDEWIKRLQSLNREMQP